MFLFLFVTILILIIYYTITRKYGYFKDKKIPHLKPKFLLGNYGDYILRRKFMGEVVQGICKQFPNEKLVGAYYGTEPVLIPVDPEMIKLIMTKEFAYFHGRELSEHNHKSPISLNLSNVFGDRWKVTRQNMTPLFTSAKMKNMFHLIENRSHIFETMLDKEVKISKKLNVKNQMAKFTIECIVTCAFGIEANTMTDNTEANYFNKIVASFNYSEDNHFYRKVMRHVWPSIYYGLGYTHMSTQVNYFSKLVTSVMEERNYKSSGRNDFVDLILSWKLSNQIIGDSIKSLQSGTPPKVTLPVTDDLLVAQCYIFFLAGFESSSTTLSYTLFELAKNPKVQEKVLQEVDEYMVRHNNKLEYECISEMPFLQACIDEALRLYPLISNVTREQMEDYTFPDGTFIEKGKRIHIPLFYLHHNPKYFPNPEEYRPERFLGEEKNKIVPYTYLPFGEGPRICIGMRFAKMQMIAGLATILKKYRLELADGMPRKLKLKPESLITHTVGGIYLDFIERDGWENRVFVR